MSSNAAGAAWLTAGYKKFAVVAEGERGAQKGEGWVWRSTSRFAAMMASLALANSSVR